MINRKDRWTQFRKFICARARCQFFFLLTQRGFRGSLSTDHTSKTLDLTVCASSLLSDEQKSD